MSELEKDQVINKFTEAYTAANGKAPEIEEKGGWYSVNGDKNIRLAQLDELADELAGGKPATKTKAKAKKVVQKGSSKKSSKVAKKKPKAKKTAKDKQDSFSVKAMWLAQIEQQNPGSIPPR